MNLEDIKKERAVDSIAFSLRELCKIVNALPEGDTKETIAEEIRHIDFCMSILFPIREENHE